MCTLHSAQLNIANHYTLYCYNINATVICVLVFIHPPNNGGTENLKVLRGESIWLAALRRLHQANILL